MAPLIRPAVARLLAPFVAPALLAGAGLWLARLGGWLLLPAGLALMGLAGALALVEWRRQRLGAAPRPGPGLIELSEGILRYWGTRDLGGEIALRELVEIRLLRIDGHAFWRLRSRDNQALLVPVDAGGAEVLADAFAALPGVDIGALAQARQAAGRAGAPMMQVLWRRPVAGAAPPAGGPS